MATDCIAQVTFEFDPKRKPVVAVFDAEHASSDGGAILLKGIDTQLGLTKCLAACLDDPRQPGKVQHQTLELFRQRVFGLACGYADCNDAARLADDAIHKLLIDRDPIAGPALASQPTLSRFENAVGWRELLAMGHVLADTVVAHLRRRGGAVCRRRRAAPRQRAGQPRGLWSFAVPDSAIACGISRASDPGAPRWGLRLPHDVCIPRGPTGRVRRGDGEQCPVGDARPALDGQGPDAVESHRTNRASLRGDALRRQDVEAPAT